MAYIEYSYAGEEDSEGNTGTEKRGNVCEDRESD